MYVPTRARVCACVRACVRACAWVRMCAHVRIHVGTHVRVDVYAHVRIHVHAQVHTHVHRCAETHAYAHVYEHVYTQAASPDVEDPFIWQDGRGNFHALFHKFTDEHPGCGGHAFSHNGFDWTLHNVAAYETTVRTADGADHAFNRRERPHLLFEEGTARPTVLYTTLTNWSSSGANDGHDKAFTFAQRIGSGGGGGGGGGSGGGGDSRVRH